METGKERKGGRKEEKKGKKKEKKGGGEREVKNYLKISPATHT